MTDALELVAVDIETTGLTAADEVTVVGFALPLGVRVFCRTSTADTAGVEARVKEQVAEHVRVSTHASERAVLAAVADFAAARLNDADVLLVAYNGETWRGGFDLPFLRTRYATTGEAWPFRDIPYADVLPLVRDQFTTAIKTEAGASSDGAPSLDRAYEVLGDSEYDAVDPFEESEAAVTAFEAGRYGELVLHNVADVLRTRQLAALAQRYCSKSDFNLKSVSPVYRE